MGYRTLLRKEAWAGLISDTTLEREVVRFAAELHSRSKI